MDKPAIVGGEPIRKESEFIIFSPPLIEQEEIDEVVATLKSGWIGTGPRARLFEDMIKEYIGTKHAIATNSCTAAMHLSLLVNNIGPDDEVILPPITFSSTANVIEHVGAKPVFTDISLETLNIDPDEIKKKITEKTKAIMPVHLAGLPCEMDEINKIARENNLIVIEDAAHAIGAEYKGKKIGNLGNLTCFSFYPTKNITTIEGGIVTTNDDELAKKIKIMSLHGLSLDAWGRYTAKGVHHYQVVAPGFKYNMPDVSAAIGIQQFKKLNRFLSIRKKYAEIFNQEFDEIEQIVLPFKGNKDFKSSWHMYIVRIKPELLKINRDEIMEALRAEGIGTGIHFEALHLQPYYKNKYGFKKGDLPNAEIASENIFSLSLSPKMTEKDVLDTVKALKRIIEYFKK